MGNFEDFDLDLKKVAESGKNEMRSLVSISLELSIKKCNEPSVTPPTTGMTVGCCKKENEAEPRCV